MLSLVLLLLSYFGFFDLGLSRATANLLARERTPERESGIFWGAASVNTALGALVGLSFYLAAGPAAGSFHVQFRGVSGPN